MLLMFMPCCRLQPTLKAFGTGYLLQLVPMLLGQIKHIIARPGLFDFLCTVVCKSIHGESLNDEIIILSVVIIIIIIKKLSLLSSSSTSSS